MYKIMNVSLRWKRSKLRWYLHTQTAPGSNISVLDQYFRENPVWVLAHLLTIQPSCMRCHAYPSRFGVKQSGKQHLASWFRAVNTCPGAMFTISCFFSIKHIHTYIYTYTSVFYTVMTASRARLFLVLKMKEGEKVFKKKPYCQVREWHACVWISQ